MVVCTITRELKRIGWQKIGVFSAFETSTTVWYHCNLLPLENHIYTLGFFKFRLFDCLLWSVTNQMEEEEKNWSMKFPVRGKKCTSSDFHTSLRLMLFVGCTHKHKHRGQTVRPTINQVLTTSFRRIFLFSFVFYSFVTKTAKSWFFSLSPHIFSFLFTLKKKPTHTNRIKYRLTRSCLLLLGNQRRRRRVRYGETKSLELD